MPSDASAAKVAPVTYDKLTVIAIAALACNVEDVLHEGLGFVASQPGMDRGRRSCELALHFCAWPRRHLEPLSREGGCNLAAVAGILIGTLIEFDTLDAE